MHIYKKSSFTVHPFESTYWGRFTAWRFITDWKVENCCSANEVKWAMGWAYLPFCLHVSGLWGSKRFWTAELVHITLFLRVYRCICVLFWQCIWILMKIRGGTPVRTDGGLTWWARGTGCWMMSWSWRVSVALASVSHRRLEHSFSLIDLSEKMKRLPGVYFHSLRQIGPTATNWNLPVLNKVSAALEVLVTLSIHSIHQSSLPKKIFEVNT